MNIQINSIARNEIDILLSMMKKYAIDNYTCNAEIVKKTALELINNKNILMTKLIS